MSFEYLPNEIWLDTFIFLEIKDLNRAFYGLNSRCNALLIKHMKKYGFDLRSISKTGFEFICQSLQSNVNNIKKLCLSDDEETPYETKIFLEHGFTFDQFISLNSLSLFELGSDEIWSTFINGLSRLSNLTNLKLIKCFIAIRPPNCNPIFDKIWKLPKLIHGHFDINFHYGVSLSGITTRSLTLKHLTLQGVTCRRFELSQLFKYTPELKSISIYTDADDYGKLSSVMSALTSLELHIYRNDHMITNILLTTPNLCYLKMKLLGLCVDGHQWKHLIETYLPKLKTFQFKMNFTCRTTDYDEKINRLKDSFTSQFWLKERKCYVHFYSISYEDTSYIYSYTIPYGFSDYNFLLNESFLKSAYPKANDYLSYDSVESLYYNDTLSKWYKKKDLQIKFSNVRHLTLMSSNTNTFWSLVQPLNKLKSLKIGHNIPYSVVKTILNQAPQLNSFSLHPYLFPLNHTSIYRLELLDPTYHLSEKACLQLSQSPLLSHCEILLINIQKIEYILPILKNSFHLRALTIYCKDDSNETKSSSKDRTIKILRSYLPNTAEIGRDPQTKYLIRAWIR